MLRRFHLARYGRDVNDCAGPSMLLLTCFLQHRQEGGTHEVALADVRPVDVVPVLKSGAFVIEEILPHLLRGAGLGLECLGVDAGIVDEDVENLLLGGELVVELGDFFLLGDVASDGNNFARDILAVGIGYSLEFLFCAAADVNLGSVDCLTLRARSAKFQMQMVCSAYKCLDQHQPDARTTSSNQRHFVLDIEDVLELEVRVVV
jgi:hypothetical protein